MAFQSKQIPLTQLQLNQENPRHPKLSGEPAVIDWMLETMGRKIVNLADAIVSNGWDPTESILVLPAEGQSNRFVVIEGNRRITAAKLLANPDRAQRVPYVRRFRELAAREGAHKPPKLIQCVVAPDMDACWPILEAKHNGEANGVGRVAWVALERDRAARIRKGTSRYAAADNVLDIVAAAGVPVTEGVPITTLDRIIKDKHVQGQLGIQVEAGKVEFLIDPDEAMKGLKKIVTDLQGPDFTVNDVKTKDDRRDYIDSFQRKDRPNLSKKLTSPLPATSVANKRTVVSRPGTRGSKTVLLAAKPPAAHRAAKIVRELKSLKPADYPNASAVLMRVLLEISVDAYLDKKKATIASEKLHLKLIKAVETLAANNAISTEVERTMKKIGSRNDKDWFTTDTLHQFVHSLTVQPLTGDIKSFAEMIDPFLVALWDDYR